MANLNEITKKLNDAANVLQSLASEQVKVVEHSVLSFINSSELIKQEEKRKEKYNSICDRNKEVLDTTESNLFKKRKSFYSSFSSLFSKSDKQITSTKSVLKKFGQDTIKIFSKGLFKSNTETNISSDNTNDFLRTDRDSNELQIELLTSINNKIATLSNSSSGGLFDFLMNGIPKLLSLETAAEVAGGVGAAGAGAGLLAKYSKWFKLPVAEKLKPVASFAGKNLKRIASPKKLLGAAGISLAAGTAMALAKGDDEENKQNEIEARAKGGKVAGNIPYLVGEKGPELFVPNNSGDIKTTATIYYITEDMFKTYSTKQIELMDTSLSKSLEKFSKPFDKNVKKYSTSVNDQFKTFNDTFQSGWDFISDGFKKIVNKLNPFSSEDSSSSSTDGTVPPPVDDKILSTINSAPLTSQTNNNTPTTNVSNGASTLNNPSSDVPRSFYGDYDVKETGIRKIHAGEMVIPSNDAELIRATSELRSNYSINSSPAMSKSKLSEDFWMKTFVPAFANAIKIDKEPTRVPTRLVANSTNPFG